MKQKGKRKGEKEDVEMKTDRNTEEFVDKLMKSGLVEKVYWKDGDLIVIPKIKSYLRAEYFMLERICSNFDRVLFIDLREGYLKCS